MTKYQKVELEVTPHISTRREIKRCEECGEVLIDAQVSKKLVVNGPRGKFISVWYCVDCVGKRQTDTELRDSIVKRKIDRS